MGQQDSAYREAMADIRQRYGRQERDNWEIARTIHYWTNHGHNLREVGEDSGMGVTNASRYYGAWDYFGDNRIPGESFTAHAYLSKQSADQAVRLLAEAEVTGRGVVSVRRSLTNAALAEVAEGHSDPDKLVAVEQAMEKVASHPRLAEAARQYATEVRQRASERGEQLREIRERSAPMKSSLATVGTTFLGQMLEEAVTAVRRTNEHDGDIADWPRVEAAIRALAQELTVYANRRSIDTDLVELLGGIR